MNRIPNLQNEEAQLALLRARKQIMDEASQVILLQFLLTVIVPALSAVVGFLNPAIRPYTAALALGIALLDVTVLDRMQRRKIKLFAKIAEAFDEAVLQLPWNRLAAGKRPEHSDVAAAQAAWSRRNISDAEIVDWYPVLVGRAPLHLGRIICQRTNLWYDSKLRRHYGAVLLALAILLPLALLILAWVAGLTIDGFVTTVLAPAAPILTWSMRELFRQKDTADSQDVMRTETEALWARAKAGECSEPDCLIQSRELQNAIYTRRATSGLIFPGLYSAQRDKMERDMKAEAAGYLKEIGITP